MLVAVGRAPRTDDVGLDKTKIKPDRGFIMTNEWMETTEPGIYAIGDIVGGLPQLAHVGAMAGLVVAAKIAGKYAKPVNRTRIPGCTYTDPQIASVGLTEAQAKEKGFQVKVGKFPFVGNSKATIVDAHDGFVKVVADAKYGEILGVHIIGPYATEIIAEAVTAIELEATVEEMMFTIHAHPTVAEALLDGFSSVEGMADQRLALPSVEFIEESAESTSRVSPSLVCAKYSIDAASPVQMLHRESSPSRPHLLRRRPRDPAAGHRGAEAGPHRRYAAAAGASAGHHAGPQCARVERPRQRRIARQRGVELHEINRGGDVTYHGPGQLVGYPIVDLRGDLPGKKGPHLGPVDYVRLLEEVLIRTCGEFGVMTQRICKLHRRLDDGRRQHPREEDRRDRRAVSQGVTSHGFALNVTTDLRDFEWIVPCGITDREVTSLELEADAAHTPTMEAALNSAARNFGRVFERQMLWCESLDAILHPWNKHFSRQLRLCECFDYRLNQASLPQPVL